MVDDAVSIAGRIASLLSERGETLAVAETAAGGLISASLLAVPGASAWFLGGAVAYSATAKAKWLGLDVDSFGPGGVVSQEGVTVLARATRVVTEATWSLAEAGIAGPQTGRRSSKPAGLAWLGVSGPVDETHELRTGRDDRAGNQRAFTLAALDLLEGVLRQ